MKRGRGRMRNENEAAKGYDKIKHKYLIQRLKIKLGEEEKSLSKDSSSHPLPRSRTLSTFSDSAALIQALTRTISD